MPCGSCAERQRRREQEQAALSSGAHASRPRAVYVVTTPEGDRQEFSRYEDAAVYRRQTRGTLTTTTAT